VLALGARVIGSEVARDCLKIFLETEFEGGRHQRRVDKMTVS
jgi:ribose 5-phosphate isomerase B